MEPQACDSLRSKGHEVMLPMREYRDASRHMKIEPLFGRYLFATPNPDGQWIGVLSAHGVSGIIRGPNGLPRMVPGHVLAEIRDRAGDDGIIRDPPPARPKKDATYRVVEGSFTSFLGQVTRDTPNRVWLLLSVLGRSLEIDFPLTHVEAA